MFTLDLSPHFLNVKSLSLWGWSFWKKVILLFFYWVPWFICSEMKDISRKKKMTVNDSNTGVFIRENARHWFLEQPACKWLKTKKSPLTKSSSSPLRCYVVRNPKVKKIIEINLTNKVWRLIFRYWSDVGCCNDAVLKHTPPPPGNPPSLSFWGWTFTHTWQVKLLQHEAILYQNLHSGRADVAYFVHFEIMPGTVSRIWKVLNNWMKN